jgi:tetratricopeptide (TPR) repeat protein
MRDLKVQVLSRDGTLRTEMSKALETQGFTVNYNSSYNDYIKLANKNNPHIFLLVDSGFDKTQFIKFLQRIGILNFQNLQFTILVTINPPDPFINIAEDTGISKIINADTSPVKIASLIRKLYENDDDIDAINSLIELKNRQREKKINPEELDEEITLLHNKYPENTSISVEYGGVLIRADQIKDAIALADDLIARRYSKARAFSLKARAYYKMRNFKDAISILQEANILSPHNPGRLTSLGSCYFKIGEFKLAKKHFDQALSIAPDFKEAMKGMSAAKLQLGETDSALEIVSESLSEDEKASLFNNYGVSLIQMKKFSDGLSFYEIALKILTQDTYKAQINFNIALAYLKSNRKTLGLKHLKKSINLDPELSKASELYDRISSTKKTG